MDVNRTLKVGFVKVQELIIDVKNDGTKDGLCSLKGVIGNVFNIVLQKLFSRGFRCTLTRYDAIGNYEKELGSHSGAIGALQRGEIEFLGMPVYFPLIDPGNNFTYTPILYEDTMTMLSGYRTVNTSRSGDLFTMFTQVPYGLWIGYFISFFTFILVTFVGSRILMKKYSSFWMTTCAFLDQDNFPTNSLFISVLSSVVMTGILFMMTYATSSMSTDLVTMDKPIIITSYDEVIEQNMTLGSTMILPEWETFVNAPRGSKEQIMFKNSMAVSMNPTAAMKYQSLVLNQKFVIVARSLVTFGTALAMMAIPGWPSDGRTFVGSDEQARKHTNVFIISSTLKGTPIERRLSQVVGRLGEHGFAHYVQERSIFPIIESMLGDSATSPSQQQKITRRIQQQRSDVVSIGWNHIYNVLIMLGSGIGLAAFFLPLGIATFKFTSWIRVRKARMVRKKKIWHVKLVKVNRE